MDILSLKTDTEVSMNGNWVLTNIKKVSQK